MRKREKMEKGNEKYVILGCENIIKKEKSGKFRLKT